MDYSTLQTTVARGQFDATADLATVKDAILEASRRIWFRHRDWDFRRIGPTSLTIVAGTETPTLDVDAAAVPVVAEVFSVYDDLGAELERLPPDTFDDRFRGDLALNNRGRPLAFKWQSGALTVGPRPDANYTFAYVYDRQLGFLNAGATFKVGDMSGNTDTPAWDARHHRVLIPLARALAANEQTSAYAQSNYSEYDDGQGGGAIAAMEAALLVDMVPPAQWPSQFAAQWPTWG